MFCFDCGEREGTVKYSDDLLTSVRSGVFTYLCEWCLRKRRVVLRDRINDMLNDTEQYAK